MIPSHYVLHVAQTQADERGGGGGEKTERRGEEEKGKLVKTNAGSRPKKKHTGEPNPSDKTDRGLLFAALRSERGLKHGACH